MHRLAAITKRLHDYTREYTNTDEKLETGAINEWLEHSDADMAWLLRRIDELMMAGRLVLAGIDAHGTSLFDGSITLRQAISNAVDAEDGGGGTTEAVRRARGGDAVVKRRGCA